MLRIIAGIFVSLAVVANGYAQEDGGTPFNDVYDRPNTTYVELGGNVGWGPNTTFLVEGGVGLVTEIAPDLRAGVTDVMYTSADQLQGNRHGMTFAPTVEFYKHLSDAVAFQGRLAIPLQIRWGADLDSKLGVQPYVQAGFDWFASEDFSVGGYARSGFVATQGFIRSPRVLPQSAVSIVGGAVLKYHF